MQRRRKARALPSVGLAILLMGFAVAPVIATQSAAYAVTRSSGFSGPAPGKVTCSYLAKVTFSSPLTTAGGGTGFAPVKGKLSNCQATSSGLPVVSRSCVVSRNVPFIQLSRPDLPRSWIRRDATRQAVTELLVICWVFRFGQGKSKRA